MSLSIGQLVGYVDMDTSKGETAMDKFGSFLESKGGAWGKMLASTAVVAGGAFGASLAGAMDLEPSRDRVAASLGLTEKEAARVGKVSGELFADAWGESASDVDAAIEAVVSSIDGMRTASEARLRGVTEAALTLASVFEVDVVRATQVAGNMMTNGLAKNATQAFDLLTAALSKVPVQLREDVMDAADEYGQFFNSLGIDGPKAMALLASSAGKGMYGIDKMGDAIKEFTILATDGSKSTALALESLGLDFNKVENDLLAGGGKANKAFNEVVDALLRIKSPAKQGQTALALFGTPLEDLGKDDVPKFLKSLQSGTKGLGDFKGATARAGKTLNDNAATNLTGFTRKIKGAFIDMLGGKVLPKVTEFTAYLDTHFAPAMDAVGDAVGKATGFFKEHSTITKVLGGVILSLTAVTMAHAVAMGISSGALALWITQTKIVKAATAAWAAVQWALNTAFWSNPITLVVLAIAGLIAAVIVAYNKVGWFKDGVNAAFGGIKAAAIAVGKFFTDTLPAFFRNAWNRVVGITRAIVGGYITFYVTLPKRLIGGIAKLGGMLAGVFRGAWNGAISISRNMGETILGWIRGIPGKIGGLGKKFGSAGKQLLQAFIDGMKNAAGIISGIAGNVWNSVRGLLNGAIDKINNALDFKIGLPGPDLHVNIKDIPHLATGGRATADTLAVIGDGREPESVLPDSMLRGLLERAHAAGRESAETAGSSGPFIGHVTMRPDENPNDFAERLWWKWHTRP